MKTAHPLDRHDLTRRQPPGHLFGHLITLSHLPTIRPKQTEPRAAFGATVGLGMKPPVARIIIFPLTGGTHDKTTHGRMGTIVGDTLDNGVAGAAVGTVDKGITKPSVSRIKKLGQTGLAHGHIGGDQGGDRPGVRRVSKDKFALQAQRDWHSNDLADLGQGRGFFPQGNH